eukprot:6220644-Amphidinium_carterae.1
MSTFRSDLRMVAEHIPAKTLKIKKEQQSRLLQQTPQTFDFNGTSSSIGNHYCKNYLYDRYWHLRVVDTYYTSEQERTTIPIRGKQQE